MRIFRDEATVSTGVEQVISGTRTAAKRGRRLGRGRTWILATGDVLALVVAYALAYAAAAWLGPLPPVSAPAWFLAFLAITAVPVWLAVFTGYHLYENDALKISVSSFDEVRDVFHAMLAGSLGYLILSQGVRFLFDWWVYTAVEAALFAAAALVLVPVARGIGPQLDLPPRDGAPAHADRRRRRRGAARSPEAQRRIPSTASTSSDSSRPTTEDVPGPMLGASGDIARIVDEHEIDRVLLASSIADHEEMLDLLRTVRRPDVQISIVPRYNEIFTSHATLDDIEGMPVVTLPPLRLGRSSRLLKRSFDVCASGAALTLLAPVLGVVALVVRLDSSGPAFYRQKRRGRAGSTFEIVKFRTMRVGAENERFDLVHLNEVDGPLFKIKGEDPRVTRVGAFLRKTSIDELPQLWNVLRGDMSLVGPRPFVVHEADQITGWASKRLDMTPGITGLWQVLGRNDIPFDEMTKLDYLYVTNWSLWWDLKILCQTIPVVLGKRGAY